LSTTPHYSLGRSYFIFTIVVSGLLMASIDATIVAVALPAMLHEMHTSLALVSWSLTAYMLTQTVALPLAGRLADRWGRKRLFLTAVVLFSAGSAGCGISPNIYVLIAFRILQASGGGMFFPCVAGVIGDVFQEGRQTAIGLIVTSFQLGGIIGPNIGGLITDNLSWRWVFFVNLPIGAAILLLGLPFLPKDRPRVMDSRRFDYIGTALFAAGISSLLYGLTFMANNPDRLENFQPLISIAAGVAVLATFVFHETRTTEPVIDLNLIRWRPFLAANLNLIMNASAFNGFFNFVPYYATIAYGMSATQSGAILTPRSLTAVVISVVGSVFILRLGYRKPWLIGQTLLATGMVLTGLGLQHVHIGGVAISNFALLSAIMCITGLGIGIAAPPSNNAAMDLVADRMATAAGLRAMFGNTGAVVGTAMVTLILSRFGDKVAGMQYIFLGLGCVIFVSQVWVFWVPDMVRGGRRAQPPRELELAAVD